MKKLLLVSGPDRVGKSTLCSSLSANPKHFAAPSGCEDSIYEMYYRELRELPEGISVFDRGWVCSYILEDFRRHCGNHLYDVMQLEIDILDLGIEVLHIGLVRPWHFSARLHLEEIRADFPELAEWRHRDILIERRNEHFFYIEKMKEFYTQVSLFPHVLLEDNTNLQLITQWL